jgi:hypothetical protein
VEVGKRELDVVEVEAEAFISRGLKILSRTNSSQVLPDCSSMRYPTAAYIMLLYKYCCLRGSRGCDNLGNLIMLVILRAG